MCIWSVLSSHSDRSIIYEVRCVCARLSLSVCTHWITVSRQTIATPLLISQLERQERERHIKGG